MNESFNIFDQLLQTWYGLMESAIEAAPRMIAALVLIVFAFIVAKIIERVTRAILGRLKLDALVAKVGLDKTLQRLGMAQPLSVLLPRVIYFLLLFLFTQSMAQALGLDAISQSIGSFLAYLPNLVAAVLLVVIGSVIGQFAGSAATRAAKEAGIDFAGTIGSLVSMVILLVAAIMALSQLQIHTEIVLLVTVCGLAGFALAFGLSFGLGTREITRNIVAGFYVKKLYSPGEPLEVEGHRGVLKAITPTQTVLEQEGGQVTVSNVTLIDSVVKQ